MTDAYGYRDDAGDPYGAWLARNTATMAERAKTRGTNLANTQTQQQMSQQQEADNALPNILFALGQNQGQPTPQPGQASTPSGPPGGGGQPPQQPPGGMSMPMQPGGMSGPSPMGPGANQMPTGNMPQMDMSALMPNGQGPSITRMDPGSMPPPPPPPQQGGGPNIQRMGDMGGAPQPQQQPQGGAMPNMPGATPGYDLPSVVQAIKQQYPNISGGALRNMLTTLNPLILTPAARAQLQMIKQMYGSQQTDKRIAAEERGQDMRYDSTTRGQDMRNDTTRRGQDMRQGAGADEEKVNAAVEYAKQFGIGSIPAWLKPAVIERLSKDGSIKDIPQNLANNAGVKAEATSQNRALGTIETQTSAASNILDSSLPSLMTAAQKLGLGPSTDLNTLTNFAKRHMSNEDYTNYSAQLRAVATDYAMLIGRGKITVHSDDEALKILNQNMGQASLKGFQLAVKAEVGNLKKGISKTKQEIRGAPAADTSEGIKVDGPNPNGDGGDPYAGWGDVSTGGK